MLTYESRIGDHIDRVIVAMIELANTQDESVTAVFNGVDLFVRPGADPVEVAADWTREMDRRAEAYRRSPEGIAAAEARAEQIVERQARCDALVFALGFLDFSDLAAVLRWLDQFAEVADDVGVTKPSTDVLFAFVNAGFVVGANTGDAFDISDPENVARWIIGQALDGIKSHGAPHPVLHKFATDWLTEHGYATH